jgi:anaerobic ribonucleoside-triphosphate reductase activating protein
MKYNSYNIVFQEVPDEISICFSIVGCPKNCPGCHSADLKGDPGIELLEIDFKKILFKYKGYASCVCFLGGEWFSDISKYLKISQQEGFKTCLYTGEDEIIESLVPFLDYIKIGHYDFSLGPLTSKVTNQRLLDLRNNIDLTYKFWNK